MDPWAIPYFCYALLAIIIICMTLQYRNTDQLIKMFNDQIHINKALAERVRKLEESDD